MFKLTTSAFLVSSASAAAATASETSKTFDMQKFMKTSHKGLQSLKAKATPVSASDVPLSTTATAGDWVTISNGNSCPASTLFEGYLMGECTYESDDNKYYKYSCTEDSNTNTVTVTINEYASAGCTTTPATSTVTLTTACVNGETVSCTTSDAYGQAAGYADGGIFMSGYTSNGDCSGSSDAIAVAGLKGCYEGANYGADSVTLHFDSTCSGSAVYTFGYSDIFPPSCTMVTDDDDYDDDDDSVDGYDGLYLKYTWNGDDDDDCFHVDSKIDYKGVEYTYEELKAGKEPECTVPHSPFSKGVVITTSCDKTVRVTDTHLMATSKGFQLAYSLKAGDVLFGDYDKGTCTVTSVEKEKTTQQYFGLNCVHSEVLASGLRASTFGDFHTLPSWYMTYVGGLVGKDTASYLGEYIAEWYFQK